MKRYLLSLGLACSLIQPLTAQLTLIDENFNTSTNSTYGISGDVLWAKNSGTRVNNTGGALVLTGSSTSTVNTQALVRFDSTSLAAGSSLTLTFNYSLSSVTSGALRIGLFDSHGAAIPSSGTAGVDALVTDTATGYIGWNGYVLQMSPAGQGPDTATRYFERLADAVIPTGGNAGKAVLLTNIAATYYTMVGSNATVDSLSLTGTAQLVITRLSDTEVGLDFSIEGAPNYTVSTLTTYSGDLSFDTLGFNLQGGGNSSGAWTIDNVVLTTAAIPEPGTTALLFGGLALAAGILVHRRRQRKIGC